MWCKGVRRLFNIINEHDLPCIVLINKIFISEAYCEHSLKVNKLLTRLYSHIERNHSKSIVWLSHDNNTASINKDNKLIYSIGNQKKIINLAIQSINLKKPRPIDIATTRIKNNDLNFHCGTLIVEDKTIKLGSFPAVNFDKDRMWEFKHSNRSWTWRLHWFSFIPYLITYHARLKDDIALDIARDLIMTWFEKYIDKNNVDDNEFIWHDHGTALRLEQLIIFYFYIIDDAPLWCKKTNY